MVALFEAAVLVAKPDELDDPVDVEDINDNEDEDDDGDDNNEDEEEDDEDEDVAVECTLKPLAFTSVLDLCWVFTRESNLNT